MKIVMKFGGTSLNSGEKIKNIVKIIKTHHKKHKLVVVISAFAGVTQALINITEDAKNGRREDIEKFLKETEHSHKIIANTAIKSETIRIEITKMLLELLEELRNALIGVSLLRELTQRSKAYIVSFGERLSTIIVWGAVRDADIEAELFTGASVGIVTDSNFDEAVPLLDSTKYQVKQKLEGFLEGGIIPVVTGFIAADQDGFITLLGRGCSDYTATLIGAGIDADEVWLWSDVDGLMTADPKIVKDAKVLDTVSYDEAVEMAIFGVKGMHSRALAATLLAGIPVRFKNTFNQSSKGTTIITNTNSKESGVVKTIALVKNIGLITVTGVRATEIPSTVSKMIDTFVKKGVNIMTISQSALETNISVIVQRDIMHKEAAAIELGLLGDKVRGINLESKLAVVTAIGSGMKYVPGIVARVFDAVARRGINVVMILGSSQNNISFVVKEEDGPDAVRAIHKEFGLGGD
jgi:aspartate kinase